MTRPGSVDTVTKKPKKLGFRFIRSSEAAAGQCGCDGVEVLP
jgi:hypothetical protein